MPASCIFRHDVPLYSPTLSSYYSLTAEQVAWVTRGQELATSRGTQQQQSLQKLEEVKTKLSLRRGTHSNLRTNLPSLSPQVTVI
jgi:hypothetical protein